MARRRAPAVEEGIDADEEGVGPLTHECCEGGIDLPAGAGVEDMDLQPDGASSLSLPKTPSGRVAAVDESQHNCG
jgi:hypothetical protein